LWRLGTKSGAAAPCRAKYQARQNGGSDGSLLSHVRTRRRSLLNTLERSFTQFRKRPCAKFPNPERRLLADCVDKVGIQRGWDSDAACLVEAKTVVRCILRTFSGSLGHLGPCRQNQLGEFPQVLSGGGQQELVLSPARTAQPQTAHLEDALEMGKQHLDALTTLA